MTGAEQLARGPTQRRCSWERPDVDRSARAVARVSQAVADEQLIART
jgi:hypothetical protein